MRRIWTFLWKFLWTFFVYNGGKKDPQKQKRFQLCWCVYVRVGVTQWVWVCRGFGGGLDPKFPSLLHVESTILNMWNNTRSAHSSTTIQRRSMVLSQIPWKAGPFGTVVHCTLDTRTSGTLRYQVPLAVCSAHVLLWYTVLQVGAQPPLHTAQLPGFRWANYHIIMALTR